MSQLPGAPITTLPAAPRAPLPVPYAARVRPARVTKVDPIGKAWDSLNATQKVMVAIHGAILLAVTYHGYKRNRGSLPWGAAWALGGMLCPTVTMGFALTQGFGKKAGG